MTPPAARPARRRDRRRDRPRHSSGTNGPRWRDQDGFLQPACTEAAPGSPATTGVIRERADRLLGQPRARSWNASSRKVNCNQHPPCRTATASPPPSPDRSRATSSSTAGRHQAPAPPRAPAAPSRPAGTLRSPSATRGSPGTAEQPTASRPRTGRRAGTRPEHPTRPAGSPTTQRDLLVPMPPDRFDEAGRRRARPRPGAARGGHGQRSSCWSRHATEEPDLLRGCTRSVALTDGPPTSGESCGPDHDLPGRGADVCEGQDDVVDGSRSPSCTRSRTTSASPRAAARARLG
ncbi:hypothetical protein HBB16_08595 [Pseudonocardia sp. MCCB 268]|nr:hypothetical protein [Pseudonocardia cytotoxica]